MGYVRMIVRTINMDNSIEDKYFEAEEWVMHDSGFLEIKCKDRIISIPKRRIYEITETREEQ